MEENLHSMYGWGGRRPHFPFLPLVLIPFGIGFMIGKKRSMYMQGAHRHAEWKNGVPPFFAELHKRAHEAEKQAEPPVQEA